MRRPAISGSVGGQPGDQADRERGEVVRHFALRDLGGAQPDDRQHAEQSEAEAERHLGRAERGGDGQHADVDAEEGDDEVAAAVSAVVEGEAEDQCGGEVDRR